MFHLATGQKRQAVIEARVALALTLVADFGAFEEVLVVFVLGAGGLP
jgi:hypothetical protein